MKRLTAIVLAPVLVVAGCVSEPAPEDHYYRLNPAAPDRAGGAPALDGVLQVQEPQGHKLLSELPLIYQPAGAPNTLKQYRYHFWQQRPPAMIQRALVDHLRAAGTAKQVTIGNRGTPPDWVVSGHLRRFEHVIEDTPRVRIDLELEIHDEGGALLSVERYEATAQVDGQGPRSAVAAFERALARLLKAVREDLHTLAV